MIYNMTYRGIQATVMRCSTTGIFFGEIDKEGCSYSFQGDSLASAEAAFHDVIEECLSKQVTEADFNVDESPAIAADPTSSLPESDPFSHGKRYDC